MSNKKYEYLIVGSGAAGSTMARELTKSGKEVLLIELGRHEGNLGTAQGARQCYDLNTFTKMPPVTKDGVILWRALTAGGTAVFSAGNGVRCLEAELADFGITLDIEFAEAEGEMHISPIGKQLLSKGSKKILWASKELGYAMEPMPKFIDPVYCKACSKCGWGCKFGAKWTPLNYLEEAMQNGADILYNTMVQEVLVENGTVKGIAGVGPDGQIEVLSDTVILAAGGLGTPVILQQSGIRGAGKGLFVDLFVNVYGVTEGLNQLHEPMMAVVNLEFLQSKGFILSPCVGPAGTGPLRDVGVKGLGLQGTNLIGIMVKIADESVGYVHTDGTVDKSVTERDLTKLREGSEVATEILVKAGAKSESIMISKPQGAHPGGTAAIGKVVGKDLQTNVNNLFVCDASVLPTSPGLPPILTIVAITKWLAKTLIS